MAQQDLKKLSYAELKKLLGEATGFVEFDRLWVEWKRRLECDAYEREGKWDQEKSEFIGKDGFRWKSIGCVDYGNDNFWEVMVLVEKPERVPCDFAGTPVDNFPVFFASHDEGVDTLGQSREEFLAEVPPHHMNTVLIQLGSMLDKYAQS